MGKTVWQLPQHRPREKGLKSITTMTDARDDKLRRNRMSAQKCRLKRKAVIENMENTVTTLSAENARLLEDNMRLKAQLAALQAQSTPHASSASPLDDTFEYPPTKRIKCEEGATNSFGFSESAVFASTLLMVILSGYVATLLHDYNPLATVTLKASRLLALVQTPCPQLELQTPLEAPPATIQIATSPSAKGMMCVTNIESLCSVGSLKISSVISSLVTSMTSSDRRRLRPNHLYTRPTALAAAA